MRLTRCYVPPPLAAGETRLLPEQVSTHVARVLRARAGEALTLFDGRGGEFDATIVDLGRRGVSVRIDAHHAIERESPLRVTLLQALARAERMDLIVQKATELGVASIVAWSAGRSAVQLDGAGLARRCEHAATEAAGSAYLRLLLAPEAIQTLPSLLRPASSISLAVGPEGGFSDEELALAQRHGFESCRLGPRVLRAETAPLAALAAIQALAGDFLQ